MAAVATPHYAEAAIQPLTINPATNSVGTTVGLGGLFSFFQFNDDVGKSISIKSNLSGVNIFPSSSRIGPDDSFFTSLIISASASSTIFVGFKTTADQVGWIQMDLGGAGQPILYVAAAYNTTPDGSIGVGKLPDPSTAVPGPSGALGALAALAQGRRIRKRIKQSSQVENVAA